jgi:hypothetical protein
MPIFSLLKLKINKCINIRIIIKKNNNFIEKIKINKYYLHSKFKK